jgi:APA family basic amino acid/polyamine antiporter
VFFILVYLFVGFSVYNDDPVATANGLYLFLLFIGLYFIGKFTKRKKSI